MLTIKTIDNGWLIEDTGEKRTNAFTYVEYDDEDSKEMMQAKVYVLNAVLEVLGWPSKHGHWGIAIEITKDGEVVKD